jgi:DNA mismatch endonuclease (patch repair protein)
MRATQSERLRWYGGGMDSTTRMTLEEPRTDPLSPEERSARMALVRSRDTKPELRVRRFLHAAGLRYRLHQRVASARPDLVFPARRTVVFVHGCIWHRHPEPTCPLTRTPKSRIGFWTSKFAENVARDARQWAALEAEGWRVLVIWECQTTNLGRLDTLRRAITGGIV